MKDNRRIQVGDVFYNNEAETYYLVYYQYDIYIPYINFKRFYEAYLKDNTLDYTVGCLVLNRYGKETYYKSMSANYLLDKCEFVRTLHGCKLKYFKKAYQAIRTNINIIKRLANGQYR